MSTQPDIPPDIARELLRFAMLATDVIDDMLEERPARYELGKLYTRLTATIDRAHAAIEPGEFTSESQVRCPKCGHVRLLDEYEDQFGLLCENCNNYFSVAAKLVYVSPPLETKPTKGGET